MNHLGGAALDVHEREPVTQTSRLLQFDNVILTPHAAGVSFDIPARTCRMIADEVASFFAGRRPNYVINPKAII
jgi:D-3-phosphoglycerate dehydrogenase